jgi:hypothetical protein
MAPIGHAAPGALLRAQQEVALVGGGDGDLHRPVAFLRHTFLGEQRGEREFLCRFGPQDDVHLGGNIHEFAHVDREPRLERTVAQIAQHDGADWHLGVGLVQGCVDLLHLYLLDPDLGRIEVERQRQAEVVGGVENGMIDVGIVEAQETELDSHAGGERCASPPFTVLDSNP